MHSTPWISPLLSASEYGLAARYASTHWPILIQGETGVGKEYLAKWVHQKSQVNSGPFVPVNCSALPVHLMESELFGYEKGAFTGAQTSSPGLVKIADRGTLFLDEIGDLDFSAQAKLLRFLDTGEVRPLSGRRVFYPSVRILAASHIDLSQAVRTGKFRLDLFERLSVLCLKIPALRERPLAITEIAERILEQAGIAWDTDALALLTPYPWPGNIRQLRNILLRAMIWGSGKVTHKALSSVLQNQQWVWQQDTASLGGWENSKLWEIEQNVVLSRLQKFGGNKKRAAADLGIAKSTLHEMLRRWDKKAPIGFTAGASNASLFIRSVSEGGRPTGLVS